VRDTYAQTAAAGYADQDFAAVVETISRGRT